MRNPTLVRERADAQPDLFVHNPTLVRAPTLMRNPTLVRA